MSEGRVRFPSSWPESCSGPKLQWYITGWAIQIFYPSSLLFIVHYSALAPSSWNYSDCIVGLDFSVIYLMEIQKAEFSEEMLLASKWDSWDSKWIWGQYFSYEMLPRKEPTFQCFFLLLLLFYFKNSHRKCYQALCSHLGLMGYSWCWSCQLRMPSGDVFFQVSSAMETEAADNAVASVALPRCLL